RNAEDKAERQRETVVEIAKDFEFETALLLYFRGFTASLSRHGDESAASGADRGGCFVQRLEFGRTERAPHAAVEAQDHRAARQKVFRPHERAFRARQRERGAFVAGLQRIVR